LCSKNKEYARNNDKLHNFKKSALFRGISDTEALAGMMLKHTTSIYDFIDDINIGIEHPIEVWDEKLIDQINYLLLLRGLLIDKSAMRDSKEENK
jgi:hypothetical protein